MKFSMVTISFNQAEFLERAICSVLDQNYPELEYIVVDPGSNDGSREIIERYRPRLSRVIFEADRGPSDGLNKGFACATGEIFGFLNSDDILFPGVLDKVSFFFAAHPEVDAVSGHSLVIDRLDQPLRVSHSDRLSLRRFAYGAAVLMQPSTFFRREAYHRTSGFNLENTAIWDGELFADMALRGVRFATVDEIWSGYRVHPQSITGSARLKEKSQLDRQRIFEKIMRRQFRSSDRLVAFAFRVVKHALNPRGLYERITKGPVFGRYS